MLIIEGFKTIFQNFHCHYPGIPNVPSPRLIQPVCKGSLCIMVNLLNQILSKHTQKCDKSGVIQEIFSNIAISRLKTSNLIFSKILKNHAPDFGYIGVLYQKSSLNASGDRGEWGKCDFENPQFWSNFGQF